MVDITVLLDRSGSMWSIRDATIEAFNTFLSEQRQQPGAGRISLFQFDHEYQVVYEDQPLDQAPLLDGRGYEPRGSTALLDAMGTTIDRVGARLAAMPVNERPGKVVLVVMTDGKENESKKFDRDKVFAMVRHQTDTYSWQFVFLGANQDAIQTASMLGMRQGNALEYQSTVGGVGSGVACLTRNLNRYRSSSEVKTCGFFEDSQ